MLTRITILLSEQERTALSAMAKAEMRGLRDHIRYLLHQEAIRRGLLPNEIGGEDLAPIDRVASTYHEETSSDKTLGRVILSPDN